MVYRCLQCLRLSMNIGMMCEGHGRGWIVYLIVHTKFTVTCHTAAMWLTVALATFRYVIVCQTSNQHSCRHLCAHCIPLCSTLPHARRHTIRPLSHVSCQLLTSKTCLLPSLAYLREAKLAENLKSMKNVQYNLSRSGLQDLDPF